MDSLYNDLIFIVVSSLSIEDLSILCETNKKWQKLTDLYIAKRHLEKEVANYNIRYLVQLYKNEDAIDRIYMGKMKSVKNIKWLARRNHRYDEYMFEKLFRKDSKESKQLIIYLCKKKYRHFKNHLINDTKIPNLLTDKRVVEMASKGYDSKYYNVRYIDKSDMQNQVVCRAIRTRSHTYQSNTKLPTVINSNTENSLPYLHLYLKNYLKT
jgi:hypothetical protein